VIIRIATEGQYEIPDELYDELNALDNRVVEAVDGGDEPGFGTAFAALLALVRDRGAPLGAEDLRESALIRPPPDTTRAEAAEDFTGEGLLPD
jgi:hypothetical protein